MCKDAGWSLTELTVVAATLGLLLGILAPAVWHAQELLVLATCASGMHDIHVAVLSYGTIHKGPLPPFAFSDPARTDLPLSGCWGGASQEADPAAFARLGVRYVNLWVLVHDGLVPPAELVCPAAGGELRSGRASRFPYTFRYSTYCLRMPVSEQLFAAAPRTWDRYGMGIYALAAGGQRSPVKVADPLGAKDCEVVPQVRLPGRYSLTGASACGDGDYDVAADAMLVDGFWLPKAAGGPAAGLTAYPVEAERCHGWTFNVLYGSGSVRAVRDDGTVRANSPSAGPLADDGAHFATYAERIWQFFDGNLPGSGL